uniref:Uncharacterized protein n=1 Tax=Anguilla anguilla TaxID=7936 RepID=A0A0E9RBD8_ANGAN
MDRDIQQDVITAQFTKLNKGTSV